MFGNMLGWGISAVIAVIAVLIGGQVLNVAQPTATSGWVDAKVKPLTLDQAAQTVLPPMNDLKDDTGDLYRQASADFDRNKALYESLQKARDLKEVDYENLAGLNAVVTAGSCPAMDLFKSNPAEVVGFQTNVDVVDNLEDIAKAGEQVVVLLKLDKTSESYAKARKYAEAIEVLGYHLYKERAAYDELSKAESILGAVDRLLIDLDRAENMPDKEAAQKGFDDARLAEFQSKIEPVSKVLRSLGTQSLIQNAGDFYEIAADRSNDRVWRVEAIRRIGRLQFDAENKADQLKAPKVLTKMASDLTDDPMVRAAATAAMNMTPKDNQCNR
jgi:hypothetical protein